MAVERGAASRWLTLLPALYWLFLSFSRGVRFWTPRVDLQELVENTGGAPLERSVMLGIMAIALLIILRRRGKAGEILAGNGTALALFGLMLLSVLWSNYPGISFKRFIKTSGTLLLVLLVLTEEDPVRSATGLLRAFLLLTLSLSALFIHLLPGLGTSVGFTGERSWIGLGYTKNNLGQLGALGVLFFLWDYFREKRPWRRLLAVCFGLLSLYLLAGARSMTSLAVMIFGVLLYGVLLLNQAAGRGSGLLLVLGAIIALVAVPLVGDLVLRRPLAEFAVQQAGRDLTFTGRTELWSDVLHLALRRPWTGFGYGGFWIGNPQADLWDKYIWHPNQSHNGYLDIFLQLGFPGIILAALLIVRGYIVAAGRFAGDPGFGILSVVLLSAILLNNGFESTLMRLNNMYWFIFLLFALKVPAAAPSLEGARSGGFPHSKENG